MDREYMTAEVVLTYSPDEPTPVVLTYETDLPPAMCVPTKEPAAEKARGGCGGTPRMRVGSADRPSVRKEKRKKREKTGKKRRWLRWLLVLVLLGAIGAGIGFGIHFIREHAVFSFHADWILPWEEAPRGDVAEGPWEDGRFTTYADLEEPTIPRYPVGGEARVTALEERGEELTSQEVYRQVNPSVVSVMAYKSMGASLGTGVIMSEDGYVITNYHVIAGSHACDLLTHNGMQYAAQLVGYDAENDLAVLKTEPMGLPAAEFGSSDLLTVGDTVYAIGNPLGLELRGTLTDGIISAINRDVDISGTTMTLIQTNAALNSGNSGGPLINAYGQVVGINTIKMANESRSATVEGLGFAIPTSTVSRIVNSLIATGEVEPEPMMGISVLGWAQLPDGSYGVLVQEVNPGMGGDLGGMKPGDIIVTSDGEPVSESSDVLRTRRRYSLGEKLPVVVYRDGEYLELEIPLMVPEN